MASEVALEVLLPQNWRRRAIVARSLSGADRYDLLRTILWSLTRSGEAANVVRVLNLAVEWLPVTEVDANPVVAGRREHLRRCLEELEQAGDVASLDEGRWVSAPPRVVPIPHGEHERLLVGGVPTSQLPPDLKSILESHGPYRKTASGDLQASLRLEEESLDSWAGFPDVTLEEWGRSLLDITLPKYVEAGGAEGTFMLYAPQKAGKYRAQTKRWERPWNGASGRFLAMRNRIFGATDFRIVQVAGGVVTHSSACIGPGEARRLRYALDALAGNPTRVFWEREPTEDHIELWSEIPRSEQRVFAALGRLTVDPDRYYPRRWSFERKYWDVVQTRLQELRVVFEMRIRQEA